MNVRRAVAGMAAMALPMAACGGEAEPVEQDGVIVTRLEWVSYAHAEVTRTYTEFGNCDLNVLFPDDKGDRDLRTDACTVPEGAYDIQLWEVLDGGDSLWRYKIDDVEVSPTCIKNSRNLKVHDSDQATLRVPVEFCTDFDGLQELPNAKIDYDAVSYYINISHAEGDTFVGASRSQWYDIPVGEPLEVVVDANYNLVCYAPVGSGDCLYN